MDTGAMDPSLRRGRRLLFCRLARHEHLGREGHEDDHAAQQRSDDQLVGLHRTTLLLIPPTIAAVRVLVVLPTYCEASTILGVVHGVRSVPLGTAPDERADVLVVDDASPDGTADLVEGSFPGPGVSVLRRPAKAGLGSAYRDGFRWGLARGYEAFVEMDADGSHDPSALPTLVAPLSAGADAVIGARYVPGGSIPRWSRWRRALSRGGNLYAARLLRLQTTDATSGYRAYRGDTLRDIDFESITADGYAFQIEGTFRVSQRSGRIDEVPIHFTERSGGRSKMSARIIVEALALVTLWGLRDRAARVQRTSRAH